MEMIEDRIPQQLDSQHHARVDPNESCEFCYDVAVTLAKATMPSDGASLDDVIAIEYEAVHAHAHAESE